VNLSRGSGVRPRKAVRQSRAEPVAPPVGRKPPLQDELGRVRWDVPCNITPDQLDGKVEQYHKEAKTDFVSLRGLVSHTLIDHEERIKALEGE
jgi:hypothetical protein